MVEVDELVESLAGEQLVAIDERTITRRSLVADDAACTRRTDLNGGQMLRSGSNQTHHAAPHSASSYFISRRVTAN